MSRSRLMERYAGMRFELGASQPGHSGSGQPKPEPEYQRSIKGHLWRLLNTRQGSVLIDPAYGVPDLTLGARAHNATDLHKILETVIKRYERRLEEVRLTSLQDDGAGQTECCFLIQGLLNLNRKPLPVELKVSVLADGTCTFE